MTEPPTSAKDRPRRLLLIRVLIVLGALLAVAMGIGLARHSPPPESIDASASG